MAAAILLCIIYLLLLFPLRSKAINQTFYLAALLLGVLMALAYAILTLLPYPEGITLGCVGYTVAIITTITSVPAMLTFVHSNRKNRSSSAFIMLIMTIIVVIGITVLSRENNGQAELRADILEPIETLVSKHDSSYMIHWLQNIALFVPSGIFFAAAYRKAEHMPQMAVRLGCQFSSCIEGLQFIFRLGQCDINDITANTLGMWIGAWCTAIVLRKIGES